MYTVSCGDTGNGTLLHNTVAHKLDGLHILLSWCTLCMCCRLRKPYIGYAQLPKWNKHGQISSLIVMTYIVVMTYLYTAAGYAFAQFMTLKPINLFGCILWGHHHLFFLSVIEEIFFNFQKHLYKVITPTVYSMSHIPRVGFKFVVKADEGTYWYCAMHVYV